ncbi:uncharacterized protein EV420DRAFT_1743286 [Desarmillaria tabescens]|uniref:Uncharacterized protein n=1 Tax=Armillaria tabescens TaxID=1929756 RepID=A0AA39U0W9_ARMTA|nr:uncharacterized protein EV420DRAFT_1743286 [Desarmillaria tabescens]KAK0468449.1 hypothetical protein EV420DRAFT_1743286 [Desarmillaria tabescens]
MPRILPRLIAKLADQPVQQQPQQFFVKRKRKFSRHKSVPPRPSFDPSQYSESILLSPDNPVTSSQKHVRRKTLPPRVFVAKGAKPRQGSTERPREMTAEERRWWSSPYLRMLSSSTRRCMITQQDLPTDFLIRLGLLQLPTPRANRSETRSIIMPDGLEHSKFATRRSGRSTYVLCWKRIFDNLDPNMFRRVTTNPHLHSLVVKQISHLLRVRILQELQLLAEQMVHWTKRRPVPPILRRLTREEFKNVKNTGTIPYPNAVALLVVPPLKRDPQSKKKVEGSMSPLPLTEEEEKVPPSVQDGPNIPLSTLYPLSSDVITTSDLSQQLSSLQVPFYNGVSLFPARSQRALLHALLLRVLNIERQARARVKANSSTGITNAKGDQKGSHAFLLCSDEETIKRGDSAAVAVALWRLRMFEEGTDWEESSRWVLRQKYRSVGVFE